MCPSPAHPRLSVWRLRWEDPKGQDQPARSQGKLHKAKQDEIYFLYLKNVENIRLRVIRQALERHITLGGGGARL